MNYYTSGGSQVYHIIRPDGRFTYCNISPSAYGLTTERPAKKRYCRLCAEKLQKKEQYNAQPGREE